MTMFCFNHSNASALTQCLDCNKSLCAICINNKSKPICSNCNNIRVKNEKRKIYMELLLTFGVGLLLTYILLTYKGGIIQNKKTTFLFSMFYCYSGIVPGWKMLSNILPKMSFSFTIKYFIYFIIKLISSLFVGIIALPIKTFLNVSRLVKINEIKKTL
jgi:hypothetical protein